MSRKFSLSAGPVDNPFAAPLPLPDEETEQAPAQVYSSPKSPTANTPRSNIFGQMVPKPASGTSQPVSPRFSPSKNPLAGQTAPAQQPTSPRYSPGRTLPAAMAQNQQLVYGEQTNPQYSPGALAYMAQNQQPVYGGSPAFPRFSPARSVLTGQVVAAQQPVYDLTDQQQVPIVNDAQIVPLQPVWDSERNIKVVYSIETPRSAVTNAVFGVGGNADREPILFEIPGPIRSRGTKVLVFYQNEIDNDQLRDGMTNMGTVYDDISGTTFINDVNAGKFDYELGTAVGLYAQGERGPFSPDERQSIVTQLTQVRYVGNKADDSCWIAEVTLP